MTFVLCIFPKTNPPNILVQKMSYFMGIPLLRLWTNIEEHTSPSICIFCQFNFKPIWIEVDCECIWIILVESNFIHLIYQRKVISLKTGDHDFFNVGKLITILVAFIDNQNWHRKLFCGACPNGNSGICDHITIDSTQLSMKSVDNQNLHLPTTKSSLKIKLQTVVNLTSFQAPIFLRETVAFHLLCKNKCYIEIYC